jgi:formylglycine-generating enzyme required for sulfatase activity
VSARNKVLAVAVPLGAVALLAALIYAKQNPITYTEVRHDIVPIEPEMVEIPAGSFLMGNPWGTPEEQPVREVHLSTYRIGKYEVTNEEYRRFCDATGRSYPPDPEQAGGKDYFISKPRHPVLMISWSDMAAYCRWLSDKTGKDYHLPTEAQWEKAARGGLDGKRYSWGDERVEGMARMMLDYYAGPVEVGSFPPNGYGLYDMAGNVWEWTTDFYQEHSRIQQHSCCTLQNPRGGSAESSVDPRNPQVKIPRRVMKGGSHLCAPNYCRRYRPAARMAQPIDTSTCHLGFRCVVRDTVASG